jgi:hypothetical protein
MRGEALQWFVWMVLTFVGAIPVLALYEKYIKKGQRK